MRKLMLQIKDFHINKYSSVNSIVINENELRKN